MWQQPKTNWDTHPKAIEPADLNRIEGNILAVREQSDLPFKLEIVSALPSAAGNQGRAVFYNGRAYICDGTKWTDISGSIGDAVASNVLSGKVFSSQSAGVGITGTMPNRGAHNITPGTSPTAIPEGYHNGSGQVASLGGNAAAANVLTGKTFSSDIAGRGASGSMPNRTGHVTAQYSSVSGTTLRFRPQEGYYPGDAGNSVQLSDVDFVAANIRNGKNIFGVTGTYTGYSLKTSANLKLSADNERSTQNTTPTKLKEITMGVGGTVRVTHRLRLNGGYRVHSQVYLNGAPIGQDHDAGSTWETKTDALLFCAPGDKLQLYAWTQNSSDTAYVDNFRVYYNEVTDTEHFINLD